MSGVLRQILENRLLRASGLAAAIRVTGLLVVFLLQILLARLVADQAQYGLYVWGQNLLFLLGGLFALGIPVASGRLVAVHVHRGDKAGAMAVRRAGEAYLLLTCALGAGLGMLLLNQLPASLFNKLPSDVAALAVLGAPLVAFMIMQQWQSQACSRLVAAFLPTQVVRPLIVGLLAVMWVLGLGHNLTPLALMCMLCASLVVVLGVQRLSLWRHDRRVWPVLSRANATRLKGYDAPQIMRTALPIYIARLADLMMEYGSVLLLGVLAGAEMAASFFVADRLAQLAIMPRSVVSAVAQPRFAAAHAEGERGTLQRVLTQASHLALWPTLVIVGALWVFGRDLLTLFGAEYRDAGYVLAVLLLAYLAGVAIGPCQQVLVMAGRHKSVMWLMAVAAIIHLLALVVLLPPLGALGAAGATLLSSLVVHIGLLCLVRGQLQLQPSIMLGFLQKRER
ncbi:MAG: lipopolysaccharide biosynthesis protein [Chromatocurvus sp.]